MIKGGRENFGSRMAVIMAMAGTAIGLGNIWRFPYMVGEHGGAAFVLIYIIATLLISLPVFIAEVTVGRRARIDASHAMSSLDPKGRRIWRFAGILAIFTPLLINSYYSVIGGWSLTYLFESLRFSFVKLAPDEASALFENFISEPLTPVFAHLLFLAFCALVVAGGVKSGIEKFSKITIPVLFVLIILMLVYSVSLPGAIEGVKYLVKPDFSQIDAQSISYAMGQSFYSLSLGMGAIITYGSYVSKKENIIVSSVGTAFSDLVFAILAGLAIMPAVFAAGIEPGSGPGLIFKSIPFIFSTMGAQVPVASAVISIVFFLAVVVAAMTSCISLFEVGTSFLMEKFHLKRGVCALIIFFACGTLGIFCSLSFGPLSEMKIAGRTLFDLFDWFSSNFLLLILALLVVIFVGFVMKKEDVRDEITNYGEKKFNGKIFNLIYFLIRWVCPTALVLIFISMFQ